jgi:thiol-disulfide isomerase/thioredoxin
MKSLFNTFALLLVLQLGYHTSYASETATPSFPQFTLNNLEGDRVSLDNFNGKAKLIIFWATWCPHCKLVMPVLDEMYRERV